MKLDGPAKQAVAELANRGELGSGQPSSLQTSLPSELNKSDSTNAEEDKNLATGEDPYPSGAPS